MSNSLKNQKKILDKLGIAQLNPMQEEAQLAIHSCKEIVILSPTGTGKTLAFLLPIMAELDRDLQEVQVLILAPSRELAIQIEQVARAMGSGCKINVVYGGRHFSKDKIELKHRPALLIGTPGRIADHLRRKTFPTRRIQTLILDEFDKSLEIGFEKEMGEILEHLPAIKKKILTSATFGVSIPEFVRVKDPAYVDYLDEESSKLQLKRILSPDKDKLDTLVKALQHIGNRSGIIFCNFKNAIQRISDYLTAHHISHGVFYGGMEQKDRERALIKFRNGSHQLLLATDLAARGLDVPELEFILHYHLPNRSEEFTHRNGRTARMHQDGTAYVLHWEKEALPDFINIDAIETLIDTTALTPSKWATLFISGGRKDKISKGDIAGLFMKKGKLEKDQLGIIELKQDCAFVAVVASVADNMVQQFNNTRLKKKKVRVSLI